MKWLIDLKSRMTDFEGRNPLPQNIWPIPRGGVAQWGSKLDFHFEPGVDNGFCENEAESC